MEHASCLDDKKSGKNWFSLKKASKASKAIVDKKTEEAKKEEEGSIARYEVGSGSTLMVRAAYIRLWMIAFVDSGERRTVGQVREHPMSIPRGRTVDSTHADITVLDHLLGAVEFGSHNGVLLKNSSEHSDYLYSTVLPAIKVFFQVLAPGIGSRDSKMIYASFYSALQKLEKTVLEHGATADQAFTTCAQTVELILPCFCRLKPWKRC